MVERMLKLCCTCKNEKELIFFYKNKNTKDGHSAQCKQCAKEYRDSHKEEKKNYPSYSKEYRDNYFNENKEHINELRRERFKNNPKYKENGKKSYKKHRNKRIEARRLYYLNNLEYFHMKNKLYREKNREYIYAANRARDKKLKNVKISQKDITNLINLFDNKCTYCGCEIKRGINLHLDHIVPLCKGGEHSIQNLTPACKSCNLRKGSKSKEEFLNIIKSETKNV